MLSRLPPGPAPLPVLGSLLELRRGTLEFLWLMKSYGDISYARLGFGQAYFVFDPELIEEVLVGRHRDLVKDVATRSLMAIIGTGLITSEGELWRRQRKLAAPPLSPKRIASYAETMVASAQRMAASLRDEDVRDVYRDMGALSLEIAARTLLGFDPRHEGELIARVIEAAMEHSRIELHSPLGMLPKNISTPTRRRTRAARQSLDALLLRIIARARESPPDPADHFLARLVHARDEAGQPMSDKLLLDEAATMLLAGHETTALALTFSLYLLSEHPEALACAQEEIDALGQRCAGVADLPRLRFAEGIVREALRLYPPVFTLGRETLAPFELGGYSVPARGQLLFSQYIVQRDARFFLAPESFRPERWLDGSATSLPRFAFFPFGGGPRTCIGSHFAMMATLLSLVTLLQQVELHVVPGHRLELLPSVTLRPRAGLPMLVRRRRPSRRRQLPDAQVKPARSVA